MSASLTRTFSETQGFEIAYQMHILFPLSNTYQYHSDSDEGYTTV